MYYVNHSCLIFTVSERSRLETILDWKFDHYDISGGNELYPFEEYSFARDILIIFRCITFDEQLNRLLDVNQDNSITRSEWHSFFDSSFEPSKQALIYYYTIMKQYFILGLN